MPIVPKMPPAAGAEKSSCVCDSTTEKEKVEAEAQLTQSKLRGRVRQDQRTDAFDKKDRPQSNNQVPRKKIGERGPVDSLEACGRST